MPSPELSLRLAELDDLAQSGALLGWDQQVNMPPGGAEARGELMATLEGIHHARLVDPELAELLRADGSRLAAAVLRDVDRAQRIPADLIAEKTRAAASAQTAWIAAREANDFSLFAPALERHVELNKRLSACFPEADHPYDPLLEAFEPGMTTADVRAVFARLRDGLVELVADVAKQPLPPELPGPFPVAAQRALALEMARSMGYDDDHWRIDLAVHPFMQSIGSTDIRVTSRYNDDSLEGLFAVLHEMGHGLYERQIAPELARTTVGTGVSLGMHESQSRLWENLVGRSQAFWKHWHPRLLETFGSEALGTDDLDLFLSAINAVKPSLIRVTADEATYCLHVILRFELEVEMMEGAVAVAELPAAWNAKVKGLLGLDVPDDVEGVLQDIHWAFGEFGYFPTYAIGNIIAVQLLEAISDALPSLFADISRGELGSLSDWLRENIHRHGRLFTTPELLEMATGKQLDPIPMLQYLRAKFVTS